MTRDRVTGSATLGVLAASLLALASASASAERTQVYSIQGADCASCAERLEAALRELKLETSLTRIVSALRTSSARVWPWCALSGFWR